eukprot:3931850-Rhodomonas_salina.5
MESDRAASVGMGETVNPSRVRLRLQLNEQKYQHVRAGRGEVSKADGGKMRARCQRSLREVSRCERGQGKFGWRLG